ELQDLAEEIEFEDFEAQKTSQGDLPNDDVDGWVDEMMLLEPEERAQLSKNLQPLRLVLVKIQKIAFKIIHLMTIFLPRWREIVRGLKIADRLIPRDVPTRWNSTFDMLDVALQYRRAVNQLTNDRKNKLREFELSEREWKIAEQLCDVLKLEYFADNDWPSDWIKTAKGIVRDLFDDKYQFEVEEIKSVEPSEAARTSDNMFDNAKQLYSRKRMQLRDELDRYLNSDVKDVDNVIQWWVDHRQQYPSLSRMAFDYLMIP
ncbi:hypothetical protein C0991_007838, partial [Blastosporella zonata]